MLKKKKAQPETIKFMFISVCLQTSTSVRSLEHARRFVRIPKEVMNVSVQRDLDLLEISRGRSVQPLVSSAIGLERGFKSTTRRASF